jgi:hypothetical protein
LYVARLRRFSAPQLRHFAAFLKQLPCSPIEIGRRHQAPMADPAPVSVFDRRTNKNVK